jgi:hypothetical protein
VRQDTQELDFLMREIVIDTETTALDPLNGHRGAMRSPTRPSIRFGATKARQS